MKRFSNLEQVEKIEKTRKPIIEKAIDKILKETLNIKMVGEKYIGKNIKIDGQLNFITEVKNLIERTQAESFLITESFNMFDQVLLNTTLEKLYEMYDAVSLVPSPEDIFSSEDYEIKNDTMILTSLKNIPEDFLNFVNIEHANKYFEKENKIGILCSDDNKWHVSFIPNKNVYSNDREFVYENNNFIADFTKSAEKLLGRNNLTINNILK